MLSKAGQRLADDHVDLSELLRRVHQALESGQVETVHTELDRFWAKLAMHIRAEHLHLFPTILSRVDQIADGTDAPSRERVESAVELLREDHDFFMRQLAEAVAATRTCLAGSDRAPTAELLQQVRQQVDAVERRLTTHNRLEETEVYVWIASLSSDAELNSLADGIDAELAKLPPRLAANPPGSVGS